MKNIKKHLLLFFAIMLCGAFALFASADEEAASDADDTILFSYGTTKDQTYVTAGEGKTIYDILSENTSGNMYITLYSDCTYSEDKYTLTDSRRMYIDVNGHALNLETTDFLTLKSGGRLYLYSSKSGGVINSNAATRMVYVSSSNCYVTIGADSDTYTDYDFGKNLTIYTNNTLTSGHGRTFIIGSTIISTGSIAPIQRSTYYSYAYEAHHATFFLEGCSLLEADDTKNLQFPVYDECVFVNANTSGKAVSLSNNTGSSFTNCSFIGITPTGSEGTFTVTDATIPCYGTAEAAAIAQAEGYTAAKVSTAPAYSYTTRDGNTLYYSANLKMLPEDTVVSVTWKCGEKSILTENWQKGSIPFLDYEKSPTLSFGAQAKSAVNADTELEAVAYPADALLGSLSLHTSIDLNLYFKQGVVSDITVDGTSVSPTEIVLNKGVPYYLYTYSGMDPKTAASKSFTVTYKYAEDGVTYSCKAEASLEKYASEMLKNSDYENNYELIAALLGYVKAASEYLGEDADNIEAVLSDYVNAGVEYSPEYTSPEAIQMPESNSAVEGATFRLGTRPGFAFLLKPGFTGKLTITLGSGDEKVYNCAKGSSNVLTEGESRWVIFDPYAYELVTKDGDSYAGETLTVMADGILLFSYSIDTYIAGVSNQEGIPAAKELYNYCCMAYEYYHEKKDLPYTTDAIVVNPNGAKGVATFVIDDGNQPTATYISDVMLEKYPDLKVSYALLASYLTTLKTETDDNGTLQFVRDENGNYVYTTKDSTIAFWEDQLSLGFCEVLNHSYTHSFAGYDDNGGTVTYTTTAGVEKTGTYAEGSITAEFLAAKQIFNDLFGDYSKDVYIIPGVGVTQSDYYNSYLASLIGFGNEFIAARGTGGSTMTAEAIMNNLTWLSAPMIGYQNDTSKWTGYMDKAVADESLICYCIHRIYEDASTNTQAIYYEQADLLFGYAQELSDSGDLAIMLYYDALRYFMEKASVEVFAQTYGNEKVEVSLFFVDEAVAADSRMNYPLTVMVEVPANWKTVKYVQDGDTSYASVITVDEKTVAYINIVPGGGVTTVTAEITADSSALVSEYAVDVGDGVMLDKNYFPGYVRKSVTFTIDDGSITYDTKFLDILRPAGIKGTFNLITTNGTTADGYRELYKGYEVANHNQLHCLTMIEGFEDITIVDQVYENLSAIRADSTADINYIYKSPIDGFYFIDYHYINPEYTAGAYWHPIAADETYLEYVDITKDTIEAIFGEGSVVGYAYPHGSVSESIKAALIEKGYLYARDTGCTKATTGFALPADRFEWTYNADNSCLLDVMASYESYADDGELKMFSFGVHSADYNGSWDMLTEFAETYGNRPEDYYYATNREIFEYEDAVNVLTYRNGMLVNDTAVTLYVSVNGQKVIIPAYASYRVSDGMTIQNYAN